MTLLVKDIMVENVLTIDVTESAKKAACVMSKYDVSSLIVTSGETVVGIITERDIITRIVSSGQDPVEATVQNIMSQPLIVVEPETILEEAVDIMFNNRIKKLPVVFREKQGMRLVGILSITDVVKIRPKLFGDIGCLVDQVLMNLETEAYIR